MANYKHKYLKATRKSDQQTVARIDVGHLNKKGREALWDQLDEKYPSEDYITCYEQTEAPRHTFGSVAISIIQ